MQCEFTLAGSRTFQAISASVETYHDHMARVKQRLSKAAILTRINITNNDDMSIHSNGQFFHHQSVLVQEP